MCATKSASARYARRAVVPVKVLLPGRTNLPLPGACAANIGNYLREAVKASSQSSRFLMALLDIRCIVLNDKM